MRKLNLIKGDVFFQWKYGFYFLYFLLLFVYFILFSFYDDELKNMIVAICVYSDPAAMGMFFMGAIILLEKSQRIINSLAVSPVTTKEYILGKIISFGLISVVVGMVLITQGFSFNYFLSAIGIFLASAIFTLCGIIVGSKVETLNHYIVMTIPFELVGFVPVIAYKAGFLWNNPLMVLHPGCAAIRLIEGNSNLVLPCLLSCIGWNIFLFIIADFSVKKMFVRAGGTKL